MRRNLRLILSVLVGCVFGSLTLAMQSSSILSAYPMISMGMRSIVVLLLPGLIGSMAFAGNVHAYSLWIAAVINAIFYFLLSAIAFKLSEKLVRRFHT